jgi:hypothetical protein
MKSLKSVESDCSIADTSINVKKSACVHRTIHWGVNYSWSNITGITNRWLFILWLAAMRKSRYASLLESLVSLKTGKVNVDGVMVVGSLSCTLVHLSCESEKTLQQTYVRKSVLKSRQVAGHSFRVTLLAATLAPSSAWRPIWRGGGAQPKTVGYTDLKNKDTWLFICGSTGRSQLQKNYSVYAQHPWC